MFSCSYQQIKVGALEEARDDPVANYFLSSSDRLRQKHISSDTRVVSGLRFNPPPWIRYGEKTSTSSARGFGRIRCSGFFADYIYTLDDGTQGSNNIGLRPRSGKCSTRTPRHARNPQRPARVRRHHLGDRVRRLDRGAPDAADPLVVGASAGRALRGCGRSRRSR